MNILALWFGVIVGCVSTESPPEKSAKQPPMAEPAPGIALEIHDLQLFHPQSKTRALASGSALVLALRPYRSPGRSPPMST